MSQAPERPYPWRGVLVRWIVAVCALALLLTLLPFIARPASAVDLADRIAATRNSQAAAERAMRRADGTMVRLYRQKRATKHAVKITKRKLAKTAKRRDKARRRADASAYAYRQAYFARQNDAKEGKKETISKKEIVRLRALKHKHGKWYRFFDNMVRRVQASKRAKKRQIGSIRRKLGGVRASRNRAEAILAGNISVMTRLAQARVANSVDAELARDGTGFSWPTEGRLTQGYGCTGSIYSPRRGSCAHFHDGLDIANASGTPIRSIAAGVVAYIGWNPWDEGGRAFIMVVAHPDGFVSRYGHMLPVRQVRAGQIVRKGEVIARMGSTGNSTGSHLHVELHKGSSDVNPMSYFPPSRAIVVEPKKAKRSKASHGKPGKKAGKKSAKGSGKKRLPRKTRPKAGGGPRAAERKPTTPVIDTCDEATPVATTVDQGAADPFTVASADGFLANEIAADCPPVAPAADDEETETAAAVSAAGPRRLGPPRNVATKPASDDERAPAAPSLRARSSSPRPQ